ncbi:MAG: hypothetical protein IMY72_11030 [Bacteroidetes bacterium]|nr:hypothetical protein [Bacteroidota bacterium]
MRKYLILFLFVIPLFGNAQYFSYINKAEENIIEKKYKRAIVNYLNAYEKYQFLRSNDCYNLVLASTLKGNYNLAFKYIDDCVAKGYTIEYFKSDFFKDLHASKDWTKFEAKYDSLHNSYLNQFKSQKYIVLKELEDIDQESLKKSYAGDTLIFIDSIFYENGKRIAELIQHDSIPTVELFDFEDIKMRSYIPWVLVRHYFGLLNRAKHNCKNDNKNENSNYQFYHKVLNDSSLYNLLLGLINKGKFSPTVFREGLTYSRLEPFFGSTQVKTYVRFEGPIMKKVEDFNKIKIVEELWYKEDYTPLQIKSFNKNRKTIELSTFGNEIKTITYNDSIRSLYKDNYKYWFQFYLGTRIEQMYLQANKCRFEKVNKPEKGVNFISEFMYKSADKIFEKRSDVVFIPQRRIISHIKK